MRKLIIIALAGTTMMSCVSKKEFAKLEDVANRVEQQAEVLESDLDNCRTELAAVKADLAIKEQALANRDTKVGELTERVEDLRVENKEYFNRIGELMNNKDVTTEKFLEMIADKDAQLAKATALANKLNYKIQAKDSINLALVLNLRQSLENINDEDIDIEVKGEKVFVSISDKLLFKSGSSAVSPGASNVLSKVARILNNHDDLDIVVEGHTDSKSINTDCVQDNWDLSVNRATAIVRQLQKEYDVDPTRLTASGRSQYIPKADNETSEGRSVNRRTEIIITPRLDQFLELHQVED